MFFVKSFKNKPIVSLLITIIFILTGLIGVLFCSLMFIGKPFKYNELKKIDGKVMKVRYIAEKKNKSVIYLKTKENGEPLKFTYNSLTSKDEEIKAKETLIGKNKLVSIAYIDNSKFNISEIKVNGVVYGEKYDYDKLLKRKNDVSRWIFFWLPYTAIGFYVLYRISKINKIVPILEKKKKKKRNSSKLN